MNEKFKQYTDPETFAQIVDYPNVTEMWAHSVKSYSDEVAIVDGDSYTYATLDADAAQKLAEAPHG